MLSWMRVNRVLLCLAVALLAGCGDGDGSAVSQEDSTPTPTRHVITAVLPTSPPVIACFNRDFTVVPCPTATPTPQPTCVPTLGVASCCAAQCEPCPTIRAGCNAQGCQDCIERPDCDAIPTCGPLGPIRIPPDEN